MKVIENVRDKWSQQAIDVCEKALQCCKDDQTESIVIVRQGHDGQITLYYSTFEKLKVLGALEIAKAQIGAIHD